MFSEMISGIEVALSKLVLVDDVHSALQGCFPMLKSVVVDDVKRLEAEWPVVVASMQAVDDTEFPIRVVFGCFPGASKNAVAVSERACQGSRRSPLL